MERRRHVLGSQEALPRHRTVNIVVSILSSLAARFSGLLTQFITAWYLTADEFGLYAVALGITTFTMMLRGGGTGIIFQSMKAEEYQSVGGGLIRAGIGFGVLGALLTFGAAMPAEWYFEQDSLGWLLIWMGLLAVLQQFANYPRAKMVTALLFRQLAWIEVVCAFVKLGTAFYCAKNGSGAATFVISQIVAIILQCGLTCIWADFRRSDFAVPTHWVGPTFALIRYPLGLSIMISLMDQIDSFVASLFVPVATLGVYYFSMQMVAQPMKLVIGTLAGVLAPYGALARGNRRQENANLCTAFNAAIVFVPLFVLSIAAVYPSLERMIWGDKWGSSVVPVVLTCVFLVYPTVQGVLEGPILGMRQWPKYLTLLSWRAGSKAIGAIGAIIVIKWWDLSGESIAIALVIGVGAASSASGLLQTHRLMKECGADRESLNYELWVTPLYSLLALIATHGVTTSLMDALSLDGVASRAVAAIELGCSFVLYGLISLTLLRFAYINNLKALLFLVPQRWRGHLCTLLVIEPEDPSHNPLGH